MDEGEEVPHVLGASGYVYFIPATMECLYLQRKTIGW